MNSENSADVLVIGLEQFTQAHDRGSSHGRSRIIREAYFEHPAYVPLIQRAYDLWEILQREGGSRPPSQRGVSSTATRATPG